MPTPINPYIAGDPVGNSLAFVGRTDVLRDVLKVLRSPSQNAITLFGQRRIGKTSMLQFLKARLPLEGAFQAVYFDLQDKAAWPLPRLLSELARTVADELGQHQPDLPMDQTEPFQIWMKETLSELPSETSVVMLFDEFDVLADPQAGSSVAEFFPYLRNLLSLDSTRLQFVFVLGRNITDLGSFALSVFKGTASKRVSLLSQADTFQLARLSEQNVSLSWPETALSAVWKLTHGHPYLTQALCSQVWEDAYDEENDQLPKTTPEMVEAAASPALDASRNMLEWLWNGLGPAEKVVSAALAGAGPVVVDETHLEEILRESGVRILIRELQNAPQQLEDWDILEKANGGQIFRVELLRRWIAKYHPLSRTQEEIDRIQPAAENLYLAAESFYRQGDITRAENLLQQAIGINPYHLKANERMAEIFIANGQYHQAQELLEKLLEFAPNAARQRLAQVYLLQVETVSKDAQKLGLYDKILKFFPGHPQALAGKNLLILNSESDKVRDLLSKQKYADALQYVNELAVQFPQAQMDGKSWQEIIQICSIQVDLSKNYQSAVDALTEKKSETAIPLLLAIVAVDPHYQDVTGLLHEAITGENPYAIKRIYDNLIKQMEESDAERKRLEKENQDVKAVAIATDKLVKNLESEIKGLKASNEVLRSKILAEARQYDPGNLDQPGSTASAPSMPDFQIKSETKQSKIPHLFKGFNPFDQFKLLIWAYLTPKHLQNFAKDYEDESCAKAAGWAAHHLTWLPLFLIFLALGLGRFQFATNSLPIAAFPFLIILPVVGYLLLSFSEFLLIENYLLGFSLGWVVLSLLGQGLLLGAIYQTNAGRLVFVLLLFFWSMIATIYFIPVNISVYRGGDIVKKILKVDEHNVSRNLVVSANVLAFLPFIFSLLSGYMTLIWQGGAMDIVLAYMMPTVVSAVLIYIKEIKNRRVALAIMLAGLISALLSGSMIYLLTLRWIASNWMVSFQLMGLNLAVILITAGILGAVYGIGFLFSRHVFLTRVGLVLLMLTLAALVSILFFDGGTAIDRISGRKYFSMHTITRLQDNMSMVVIPGASFKMGSLDLANEQPVHNETVSAYFMDISEVTNQMYANCVAAKVCKPTQDHAQMDDPKYKNYPASFIDWDRANAYCSWVGARLPTEAEWEYAARGTGQLTYPWGNSWDCKRANADGNACDGYAGTSPVGNFPLGVSPFGLYDMSGNVFEWVNDWYADYTVSGRINQSTESRVFRGGSIHDGSDDLATTRRFADKPSATWDNFGFRCAHSLP